MPANQDCQKGSMPTLETNGFTRRYGEQTAVDALTFPAEDGEVFCLLGPNGAGKTTTIKMLNLTM